MLSPRPDDARSHVPVACTSQKGLGLKASISCARCTQKNSVGVWHGPYDPAKEQFTLPYMKELRLGEQLMPTPLLTSHDSFDWESRIQKEQQKISEIFAKLSSGRGITSSEAKIMYIKKVRKLPMYGCTLFYVYNSKVFASGHFLLATNASGIHFLHPITKEEIHSPFFFSDLQRWEYTPKLFCFWSTRCDFLEEEAHHGRRCRTRDRAKQCRR